MTWKRGRGTGGIEIGAGNGSSDMANVQIAGFGGWTGRGPVVQAGVMRLLHNNEGN